jgi:hypothetical protein
MKLALAPLTTNKLVRVYLTTLSTGAALTGVLFGDVTARFITEGAATSTAITLATMTVGTWASGGFKEIDAANMPGWYEVGVPNAAFASGNSVGLQIKANGGTSVGMANSNSEIQENTSVRLQYPIEKNVAFANFQFPMTLTTDHISPYTGAGNTVSGKVVLDGTSATLTNSAAITIVAGVNGIYLISLAAADLNGNSVCLIFSATNCDDTKIFFTTQA